MQEVAHRAGVPWIVFCEWLNGLREQVMYSPPGEFKSRCTFLSSEQCHECTDPHQWNDGGADRYARVSWELDFRNNEIVDILDVHIVDLKPRLAVNRSESRSLPGQQSFRFGESR